MDRTGGPSATRNRSLGGPESLESELKRLCRGRGIAAPDIQTRVGPLLRRSLPVAIHTAGTAGENHTFRASLATWLEERIAQLPADLRLVANVAFGLHPPASGRFLGDRISWLGTHLERDDRTVRRRLDEALRLLAENPSQAAVYNVRPGGSAAATPDDDWYLRRMRSLVRLDLPVPEVLEEREIVAARTGLERVTISITLPRATGMASAQRDLLADVAYGGTLDARERPSESYFRFVVTLPQPLASGESHELALRLWLPAGQPMASHYGFTPLTRCDIFQLRTRFSIDDLPSAVWLLDGVPPRTTDDEPTGLAPVALDRAGECRLIFSHLRLGRSYGVRWRATGQPRQNMPDDGKE